MYKVIYILVSLVLVGLIIIASSCTTNNPSTPSNTPLTTMQSTTNPTNVQPTIKSNTSAPIGIIGNNQGIEYLKVTPMIKSITSKKMPVRSSTTTLVPIITWGGDIATILANGGTDTIPGSIFANEGLSLKLFREDNFVNAVNKVINGDTPYLRGTMGMISSASEALQVNGIDMVTIYQLTWSTGGDCIVWNNATNVSDLRGKSIGLQLYGPHMDYVYNLLKTGSLTVNDVNIKWLRELSIPPYDTKGIAVDPMTAMQKDNTLSAISVIYPDMQALTSGGSIGTGAEGSVKDAILGLSTRTASRVISDVYAVRKDYFDTNREQVQHFVHGLMLGGIQLDTIYKNKTSTYQDLLKTSALILRDNAQATSDVDGLLGDASCIFVGYTGNVLFFDADSNQKSLRDFPTLLSESQEAMQAFGLLTKPITNITQANWDYTSIGLTTGLKNTSGVAVVPPKFDTSKVEQYIKQSGQVGTNIAGTLFSFDIFFQPNQDKFTIDTYKEEFDKLISIASTYPGAIILIEGNTDPSNYLTQKKNNVPQQVLDQIKQSAKNLSLSRAVAVRQSIIDYAKSKNIVFEPSQFTVSGAGIDKPKFATPKTETEWLSNMRVSFQIIQAEAELDKFVPAGK